MHFCHQSVQLQQGNTHLVEENEAKFAARGSSANFKMAFSAMSASESFSTRFPLKLWRLLNRCNSGAICWAEHGRSIRIDRRMFEREFLMPADSAFKTSNFSSFVRQLNLYGFRKVINTFRFNQPDTFPDSDIHEYHHPFFRRGHPDLLNRVQRRMKGRKNTAGRPDFGVENSPLVSSLLKPLGHSTPKEHGQYDRQPLHTLEINASVLRCPALRMDNAASWSGCQTVSKPVTTPAFLSTIPGASNNRSAGMELAHFASNVSNTSHMAPSNYRLQHVSGHPVVEAIQQVLGDKTLSDLVMPNSVSGESSSLYHNQTTPILPGYNALCAPQKTSTLPLNLPTNQIYPITTESLLAHAYSVDAQHSVKVANALPAIQTTAHQTRSPLAAARGELASLSQLSSLPDTVMSHLVNLCPPINSQAHPNAANVAQAQGTFHFAPANTMPNQPIHLSVTMPNLVTTERFLNNAHSNTLSTFQSSSTGLVSGQTPVRSFNLDAGNTHSGSQCAVPSAVQQQKEPFSTSAISAQSNPQVHTGIGMSHPAQHGGSYNFSSDSALSNLVTSSSLFTCTESAPLTSYAHTNQQVPDSSQSPEIQAPCSENPILPAQAGFAVKMEQMSDSDLARSSVECRNNLPAIPDNADLSSASCSGGTTIPMPSPDHTQLSIVSSNRNVNVIDSSASSFLRRLSQGGMEAGRTGDGTDVESPLKQFEQDHQTSMEGQDVFMSTIKTEML